MGLAGNITGRTRWDRMYAREWNPRARYFEMNESLRPEFYGPVWDPEACEPHSIFLSQGDYPLKGLHYMLRALRIILAVYRRRSCMCGETAWWHTAHGRRS